MDDFGAVRFSSMAIQRERTFEDYIGKSTVPISAKDSDPTFGIERPPANVSISFGLPLIASRACAMPQKVARSPKTNGPYESRAATEAAVERIHGHFKDAKTAIAKERAAKTSATEKSDRRGLQSALNRQALQLALGALSEARDSLTTAHKAVNTSIEVVKRAIQRNRAPNPKERS
jgi:hypothetical protein